MKTPLRLHLGGGGGACKVTKQLIDKWVWCLVSTRRIHICSTPAQPLPRLLTKVPTDCHHCVRACMLVHALYSTQARCTETRTNLHKRMESVKRSLLFIVSHHLQYVARKSEITLELGAESRSMHINVWEQDYCT